MVVDVTYYEHRYIYRFRERIYNLVQLVSIMKLAMLHCLFFFIGRKMV